ncbi:nuclear hormone receptor HR96 [Biomphalaria glabrata]|nr:Biomphalaria glabrata nuclear hormone receptor HR96-like [Biomphalaria glabrata]
MEMFSDIADLSSMMTTLRKPLRHGVRQAISCHLKGRIGLKSPNTLYLADFRALNRLYLADFTALNRLYLADFTALNRLYLADFTALNRLYLADFTALNRLYLADSKYLKAGLYTAFQTVSRYLEENIFLHWHSSKISLYHFQHGR